MSQITIKVNGEMLVGNTHQPLLEQLEQSGLQPEFQCRNGVCGACRCKLDKGTVSKQDTMAYAAAGEILTCASVPSGNVELEFDYQLSFVAKKAANL